MVDLLDVNIYYMNFLFYCENLELVYLYILELELLM